MMLIYTLVTDDLLSTRLPMMRQGLFVERAESAEDLISILSHGIGCDAIVADDNMAGALFPHKLRAAGHGEPLIMLSSLTDIQYQVKMLNGGADRVLTCPFHVDLVLAHILALVRRCNWDDDNTLRFGEFIMDIGEQSLTHRDDGVHLTRAEYAIVEKLALNKGLVRRDAIFDSVYGLTDELPDSKIIDVFICKLRKKMIDVCGYDPIKTHWGLGYSLIRNPPREDTG